MNDRYLKTVLTVIAGALIYLCIVATPLPGLSAQVPSIRPGEPSGPTEVVIVGWRAADAAFPVAVLNPVRVTASEPLPIRGSVTTTPSSDRAGRVILAGWEENASRDSAMAMEQFSDENSKVRVRALPVLQSK